MTLGDESALKALDEIAKLLAIQIRLGSATQQQAIIELGRVGITPSRIGELLGTTAATARVTLSRERKSEAK